MHKENKNNKFIQQFFSSVSVFDTLAWQYYCMIEYH